MVARSVRSKLYEIRGKAVKHALVNGQLILATPDAPAMATCPNCGGPVKLRNRQGTCFWRHVQLPRGGCHPSSLGPAVTAEAEHLAQGLGGSDSLPL